MEIDVQIVNLLRIGASENARLYPHMDEQTLK